MLRWKRTTIKTFPLRLYWFLFLTLSQWISQNGVAIIFIHILIYKGKQLSSCSLAIQLDKLSYLPDNKLFSRMWRVKKWKRTQEFFAIDLIGTPVILLEVWFNLQSILCRVEYWCSTLMEITSISYGIQEIQWENTKFPVPKRRCSSNSLPSQSMSPCSFPALQYKDFLCIFFQGYQFFFFESWNVN